MEYGWVQTGRKVIYVESKELVSTVAHASFNVDTISLPHPFVAMLFPNDARPEGVSMPPVLLGTFLFDNQGNPMQSVGLAMQDVHDDREYISIVRPSDTKDFLHGRKGYNSTWIEHRLSVIAARLCVYLKVFPDALVEGLPEGMKTREIRAHKNKNRGEVETSTIQLATRLRGSPIAHYRHGHFRTLRDERFRKNPDGTNRVVYVNPAIIAAKGNEETAVKVI
jgi:hypothetical protein